MDEQEEFSKQTYRYRLLEKVVVKMDIDFVITWVDDKDPIWRAKREKYTGKKSAEGNEDARYRDWDTLKYWFRGVEKFAPWVHYIYFVTDDQKPEWLNLEHPKLKWIKHTDYIPAEYLPTFHSNVIEWNFHRILGLTENFVYFNDDMFLIRDTVPEDFFVNDLPCDLPELGYVYPSGLWSYVLFNNAQLLNRHFSLKDSIRNNREKWIRHQSAKSLLKNTIYGRKDFISGIEHRHIHTSHKKSMFETLWEKEYDAIDETCQHKLRTKNDVSHWCVRDWLLLSGMFYPAKHIGKAFPTASLNDSDEAIQYLRKQKGKVICLNDSETEDNFELHKQMIIEEFEKLLPDKSAFEL